MCEIFENKVFVPTGCNVYRCFYHCFCRCWWQPTDRASRRAIALLGQIAVIVLVLLCCCAAIAEEPRVLFNQGAELAASGQFDEATEVLRQAAVVRDRTVAAKALSLLGQIAASSAREHIADNPAETLPAERETIFEHLQSAERSFAESLTLQSSDEVRKYLETLRAWRHNMANVWEEYDREQRRNTELQERIRWLVDWEEHLMGKVRPLLEEPNSPRRFQASFEAGREQRLLTEELARLSEIPINDNELAEQWGRLPEIQDLSKKAAELLTNHRAEDALPKQEQVLEYLRSLLPQEESPQEGSPQDQQNQDQEQEQNQNQNQEQEQEQDQGQNQDQQDQNEQDQNEQGQEQQQDQQNQQSQQEGEQQEPMSQPQDQPQNQPQSTGQEAVQEESPEERAERLLMQVRRKEQAARELRDQLRALLMQSEPVERDW